MKMQYIFEMTEHELLLYKKEDMLIVSRSAVRIMQRNNNFASTN